VRLILASATGLLLGGLLCLLVVNPATNVGVGLWMHPYAVVAVCVLLLAGGSIGGFVAALLRPGPWVERLGAVVWLVALPLWGFAFDAFVDPCTDPCGGPYQPVAWPGAWWVLGSYALGLVAWTVHARRPGPLPWHLEAAVLVGLFQGVVTCVMTGMHFGPIVMYAPMMPPVAAPTISSLVLTWALLRRLLEAGWQAGGTGSVVAVAGLGLWSVLSGAWTGTFRPYGGAFADTCGWMFSQMQPPTGDCHYLCTIAAQGSPWLVRPRRLGHRRGRPILVNRQLAVANAFEDLLHERWPWFGRLARRVYDFLARDLSQWLTHRWLANVLFVAMIPAQWGFELVLLLLDPGDPEQRIDRMYRAR